LIALVLLVLPPLAILSRNAGFVFPIWAAISYGAASRFLPPERKRLSPVIGIVAGQTAFSLLEAIVVGMSLPMLAFRGALAAATGWLAMTGSPWAAGIVMAIQSATLVLTVVRLPQITNLMRGVDVMDSAPALIVLVICPIATVVLLAPMVRWRKPRSSIASVFD